MVFPTFLMAFVLQLCGFLLSHTADRKLLEGVVYVTSDTCPSLSA